jgi:hypothetical protein
LDGRATAIKPAHEPSTRPECFVSYAWGDDTDEGREREAAVDLFCNAAKAKGIAIIRDRAAMAPGDRISEFMARIGRGDRVIVFLSDKYLKSTYCMTELFEVWRQLPGARFRIHCTHPRLRASVRQDQHPRRTHALRALLARKTR